MKRIYNIVYYNSVCVVKSIRESLIINSVIILLLGGIYWLSLQHGSTVTDYSFVLLFFPVAIGISGINRNIEINTLLVFPFRLSQIINALSVKAVVYSLLAGLIIIIAAGMPILLSIDILIPTIYFSITIYFIIHLGFRKLYTPDLALLIIILVIYIVLFAAIKFFLKDYLLTIFSIDILIALVYHLAGTRIIEALLKNRINEIVENNL